MNKNQNPSIDPCGTPQVRSAVWERNLNFASMLKLLSEEIQTIFKTERGSINFLSLGAINNYDNIINGIKRRGEAQ